MNDDIKIDHALPEAGPMLREAREQRGLSLMDAADALHLKPELVQALEEERMDALPPRTFVRGYLRSYARLVGLNEHDVLGAFEGRLPDEAPPPLVGPGVKLRRRREIGPWLYILLALVIAAGGFYLWGGSDDAAEQDPEAVQAPANAPAATEQAPAVIEPPASEPTAAMEAEPLPDDADIAGFDRAETEEGVELGEAAQGEPASAPTDAPAIETPAPEVPLPSAPPASVAEQAPEEEVPASAAPVATAPRLSLSIEDESWVEITDGAGSRRYAGLVQGPRVLTYDGPEPFSLVIGNAAGARLRFDGEQIDLGPHTRGKVARLTVPQ